MPSLLLLVVVIVVVILVFYCCCCEMTLAEKLPFPLVLGAYISYQVVNPCH